MYYYNIAPSRPFFEALTYSYDEVLQIGIKVEIPIGRSKCSGFIVGVQDKEPEGFKIKAITSVTDVTPYFNKKNLEFYKWVSDYYLYPFGETLSLITPSYKTKKAKNIKDCQATEVGIECPIFNFTDDQTAAYKALGHHKRNLLHGVTGSGKTEVYIEIIKDTIKQGKGVIVIVPEIALTPQLVKRICVHFKGEVSVLHSGMTQKQRYQNWMLLATGKSKLVIGARSAIFSPICDLGLIIVDEEHDQSFKQDDRLRYNARDLAFVLGKFFSAKVILSSATPSAETFYNCSIKKYEYTSMKNRVLGLALPSSVIVDMKKACVVSKSISEELASRIENKLKKNEQSIIYINRRGYANTIVCSDCGYTFKCPHCAITLTEHREQKLLVCHYCGHQRSLPNYCHVCNNDELFSVGVGTERVLGEIEKLFPSVRILRMDSDAIKGRDDLNICLNKINCKEVDIIVGTQLLGKGHDFPDVTLVGIVNADLSLQLPDFRASERTFQQIMQVSGRAGRTRQGEVVVQTYMPDHFAIRAAVKNDFESFYNEELIARKEVLYPPFIHLTDIRLSSEVKDHSNKAATKAAEMILSLISQLKLDISMLGPAPCPIAFINKRHRFHVLLKSRSRGKTNLLLQNFSKNFTCAKDVRMSIDVDPYSLS